MPIAVPHTSSVTHGDALLLPRQLLVSRFSSADRMPALLKDVVEAFYRIIAIANSFSPVFRTNPLSTRTDSETMTIASPSRDW